MNPLKLICLASACALAPGPVSAQSALVGFANYADMGLSGTTGGMGGKIVHVSTREDFAKYAGASEPYIIILDADLKGHYDYNANPKVKHDVVTVKSNKTIIGGGAGARLDSLGLDIKDSQNIIIRNLTISKADPDAIACRNTHHVWIDHCDLSSQKEENDANDGLLDFTYGSSYLTVSWCKFHDHDKSSICSSGTRNFSDVGRQRVTYHHNAFINCTQRNPRIGYGLGHIFNDYNDTNTSYAIGFFARAEVNVENCYFTNVKNPFSQMYSADYGEYDTYWGFVSSTGNTFVNCKGECEGNSDGFDVSDYYQYDFILDRAEDVSSLVSKMGCIGGIESDIIPFPGDGAIGITAGTRLACGDIEGAESYSFSIGTSPDALEPCDPQSVELVPSTTYFWKVKVNGGRFDNTESHLFRFTTAPATAHTPRPADGDSNVQLRETKSETAPCVPLILRWRSAFGAIGYNVYLSDIPALSDAECVTVSIPSWQPAQLRHGVTYYWRVDAVKSDGSVEPGDVWSFSAPVSYAVVGRNEAEDAVRGGLCFPEYEEPGVWIPASGNWCNVGDQGPGYMSFVWNGDPGLYDVSTAYYDEKSGQSWFGLYVNSSKKDEWKATADNYQMMVRTTKSVALEPGDELRLDFYTHKTMRTRTDYIEISPDKSALDIISVDEHESGVVYDLLGRRVHNPGKGIYVVDGRKVIFTR